MYSLILERLNEMASTLNELKLENTNLRKAILGIESSASSSSNSQSSRILENRSLLEIVVETQNRVKALDRKIFNNEEVEENVKNTKRGMKRPASESIDSWDNPPKKYQFLETPPDPLVEQRKRMKENFNELIKTKRTDEGKSLVGKTVEMISLSIPFSGVAQSSITLKLSNFLESDLTDLIGPVYPVLISSDGRPLKVRGYCSEVFTFRGSEFGCSILCSFTVRRSLRLSFHAYNDPEHGHYWLAIGFTGEDAPLDNKLISILGSMQPRPEICGNFEFGNESKEVFVSSGNLLARGHMTGGARPILHVEILETNEQVE